MKKREKIMSAMAEEITTLKDDANLAEPLRRVAYEAGMLLGLDATRDEQAYHRRRLNRHQYWLHGSGTLAGMVVAIDPETTTEIDPILTRMTVSTGIGVDGLGREVLINESYCIDLGDWLKAQNETQLREGYDEAENLLWLKVTVRYQECDVAQQPVLARKLNLSTDAVQASRKADSIKLELIPELPPTTVDERYQPWAAHHPVEESLPADLTNTETDFINLAPVDSVERAHREMNARLLHALDDDSINTELVSDQLEEGARLLLARISISVTDLTVILNADENDQVINPTGINVNNLVRPFLMTASQLAFLHRV
ncbi:MAG: hypothetical protein ACJATV_001228 [Granulosicoccus sp.]